MYLTDSKAYFRMRPMLGAESPLRQANPMQCLRPTQCAVYFSSPKATLSKETERFDEGQG